MVSEPTAFKLPDRPLYPSFASNTGKRLSIKEGSSKLSAWANRRGAKKKQKDVIKIFMTISLLGENEYNVKII